MCFVVYSNCLDPASPERPAMRPFLELPLRYSTALTVALALALTMPPAVWANDSPEFYPDIAPLIAENCAACHHDQGSAPFSLTTYDQIKRRSRQIAEVVEDRFMPPWKPDSDYGPALQHDRRLTAHQIKQLITWHANGAPIGQSVVSPSPPPATSAWTLGPPDLILELPADYELPAEGKDVFRNFVIPVPITKTTYIRALEFRPTATQIIHHAGIMTDQTGRARDRDAEDSAQGFASMDLGDFGNPDGHIIGWTPGQVPYESYPGTAWKLKPGTDLVVQLHLLPSGKIERIAPRIGLYFSDTPPTRTTTVVQLRELSIDIPAGEANYRVEESIVLPASTRVLRIFPHAHYLGKDFEIFAELPDGNRQPLLHIPDWDFNWQSDYTFAEPVFLPAQSRLVMKITYDNSTANIRNPSSPPQPVKWGWNSTDEMGGIVVQLLLDEAADLPRIHENLARYEISRLGAAPVLLHSLADALIKQNRSDEALSVFRELIAVEPNYAAAHRELATLLIARREWAEASRPLADYLTLHPENSSARLALAEVQINQDSPPAAIATLQNGLIWHATDFLYLEALGNAYLENGDTRSALTQFEQASALPSATAIAATVRGAVWFKVAYVRFEQGDRAGTKSAVNAALQLAPENLGAATLATFLALEIGDFQTATLHLRNLVNHATLSSAEITAIEQRLPFPNGAILLAQVLAEKGNTSTAIAVLTRAVATAEKSGDAPLQSDLKGLIAELQTAPSP